VVQLHDQRPDYIVEAGAEAAAGHDARAGLRRIEKDLSPWAGWLKGGQRVDSTLVGHGGRTRVVKEDTVSLFDFFDGAPTLTQQVSQWRIDPTGTERFGVEIGA
jgi:hypothetical protein